MTITNQTNPIGSSYTSKKSRILAPREGNLFVQETSFTTLRLTKTSNNPPTYRKEIFQHSSAKDEGNVVQIGVVNDKGEIEFNSQLDTGKANEEFFKERIQKQLKTQTKDAEKQIRDKVNADTKALNGNESSTDTTEDSKNSTKTKENPMAGTGRKNYGVMVYPSFIQKSNQDKLKVTILEFSSRFESGKLSKAQQDKNKPKKSNIQNSVITEHTEGSEKIPVQPDNIEQESKISNVSENLHITGTVYSSGKISFNGSIKGTLESKSLYVGEHGFIDGKVEADEAVILGRIKGTLKGNKVRLAASSRIEGDTYHQVIAIEDGAIYEGSIKRIKTS